MSDKKTNAVAMVTEKDLAMVEDNAINPNQAKFLLKRTPEKYIKKRPGKGGGQWDYVSAGYIKKVLNLMFGWDWDFEIIDEKILIEAKQVVVKGRLTVRTNGKTIVKMQYGRSDVMLFKGTQNPVDLGNDLKGAASDCLKKCAADLGVAADIYNKDDFTDTRVVTNDELLEQLQELFMEKEERLKEDDKINIERIIKNREENSYKKALKLLQKS
jgi:hypothetical protein